jgi:hypothetical protein
VSVAFRITAFGGIAPRVAARLLQENMAQRASNLKITSGELGPLGDTALITAPTKTMPPLSMFLAREGLSSSAWFTWPTDVDVVRAPLSVDVESRFYWTGDGEPRYATFTKATLSGLNDYPSNYWTLGVPKPIAAQTVTPSGGASATSVTRLYRYTFVSALGEESGASPASPATVGKIDDTWAIAGMDAIPANSGDITDVTYVGLSVTITTTNNHFNRVGEDVTIATVTTVTNVNGTWALTAVGDKTMTFSVAVAPTGAYVDATDTTDTWTRVVDWNVSGMTRRLYRSAGTNASYQLVAEAVGTTYNDTIADLDLLGDELISLTWEPPPVGLTGLFTHPSGALGAWVGNLLCFSEPYQPHAWPPEYQLSTDYDIVGAAAYGSEIMVGTRGNPYMVSGAEPASMSMEKANAPYPCLSKRSVVPVGNGVLYSTKQGLAFIGEGGFKLFTQDLYTEDEWEPLAPASMFAEFANGRVYVGYTDTDNASGILVFDSGLHTTVEMACSDLYADPASGNLYAGDSTGVRLWDANSANPLGMTWRSKEFQLPAPVNLGAAKIEFEQVMSSADIAALVAAYAAAAAANAAMLATGDIGGALGTDTINTMTLHAAAGMIGLPPEAPDNSVTFTLYTGERVVYSRNITSENAFRLPAGLKYDHFSVAITTQNKVRSIIVGETMASLRAA